jgi:hypothetical protein
MKKITTLLSLGGLVLILIFIGGCQNYFKATVDPLNSIARKGDLTDSLSNLNRYFILRNGTRASNMKELVLSKDRTKVKCIIEPLSFDHSYYITKTSTGKSTYKKNAEEFMLNEVHFFIQPDYDIPQNGIYVLDLDKVQKIEVIEKDKKRTTNSYVLGTVAIGASVALLVSVIMIALKTSCPFVSAYDGTDFTLQGEIYGGAIYPQLARHDYLPLRMKPLADGSLQLKITNELKEHQFTDLTELLEITHPKNIVVYADEFGHLSSISSPEPATSAFLNKKTDVTNTLKTPDDNHLLYMNDTAINSTNELVLHFNNPQNASNGKLLLNLKNSYFLDLLYGELTKGFGTYFATYKAEQKSKTALELNSWIKDQQIPLSISAKTSKGWEKITDITTIGPVAMRNMIIPIKLSNGNGPITEIKLSSGFLFWEIDYAAIDYTEDANFTVKKLQPQVATDEQNVDVLPSLLHEDNLYLSQPEIGNSATISFVGEKLQEGKMHSYILHTKGYYEHLREFNNKPNFAFLKQFKKPNAFPLFGLQFYKKMEADQMKSLAKK